MAHSLVSSINCATENSTNDRMSCSKLLQVCFRQASASIHCYHSRDAGCSHHSDCCWTVFHGQTARKQIQQLFIFKETRFPNIFCIVARLFCFIHLLWINSTSDRMSCSKLPQVCFHQVSASVHCYHSRGACSCHRSYCCWAVLHGQTLQEP